MWVRTLKITFKNEFMKESVETYMASKVDLTEGMILSYRVHVSSNVVLVNHFFPTKQVQEAFTAKLKPVREQIVSMGAKVEFHDGEVWGFKVAGDVTLDMLMNGMQTE
ncbi:MAG: hypothetical protein CMN41_08680 [SAR116 cluster bacterium]|nr:hypothetical protein [SAR116 cluster bacterium]HBP58834.1 hypothetical protein [Alphaproteobacteria bacterium]HCA92775.1 hypothetical protein [Alphaproteobacteria bacterium]|tara:strand:+ start:63 stop:386 length:324 start_codon:yes stop_codon:yes gene_type:complete